MSYFLQKLLLTVLITSMALWVFSCSFAVYFMVKHYPQATKKVEFNPTPNLFVPQFHRGDCFNVTSFKESWEQFDTPDGWIERVGTSSYLVIFRPEAEKRSLQKYGHSISIKTFDANHVKVDCPEAWTKHRRNKS